jgi:flagellar biosynthesis protein FlhF
MRIHKFEGATMRDAIAKVKAELGDQAVIISTRQVRRGLLGSAIEISAAIDDVEDNHGRGPGPSPQPRGETLREREPQVQRPFTEELEKLINPLRSEMRSLRALVRASDGNSRATTEMRTEMRTEIEGLRRLLENAMRPAPAAHAPAAAADPATPNREAPLVRPSHGKILMLVGPTGAGKTTTIAKLAANAALVEGKRVQLVTLDNYRVGGIEQIRTFADLIGVPLAVAECPAALGPILADDTYDLTLIDTAGRSPRDLTAIEELAAELPALPTIEVHVVIPAAAQPAAIDELVARYRALMPARLLFTKLDEVDRTPELALAPLRTRIAITWVTTGQAVPEDIEQPTRTRVLELANTGLSHGKAA